ncbi:hypothetical protein ACFP47_00565 [Nesterenkonia lacusekhoensis]|uniref:Lipoprotein n=1 Tax=Nesterenkonia lacusekhoensis TaxID=150832 RepID=A0ABS4T3F6_9MICC|nr:hypothetical protein [Nesterenkonia lacusekhoensis]MBP2318993.1 hypothetical protein [Nesterenkonia lacusekhoensis]
MSLKSKGMSGVAAAGLVFLVGCGAAEETPSAEELYCDDGWCDFDKIEGSYDRSSHRSLYCFVEEARATVERDSVDVDQLVEDLPDWGEGEDGSGVPVILDVATTPPNEAYERTLRIDDALEEQGTYVDRRNTVQCMEEVDQEMIEGSSQMRV